MLIYIPSENNDQFPEIVKIYDAWDRIMENIDADHMAASNAYVTFDYKGKHFQMDAPGIFQSPWPWDITFPLVQMALEGIGATKVVLHTYSD